ncbi:MAG: alpha,6-mannosyltransferase [Frankiaceae bacterium]|nr:alpha,6-mannosyltransferase [Frankiaceae bacterium]
MLGSVSGGDAVHAGLVEVLAVIAMVVSWGWMLTRARDLRPRWLVATAVLWSTPLVLAPPLLSLDAYSYLAQGRLANLGLDPYTRGPSALGAGPWLQGVDPFWRNSRSPYGPVALLFERLVVGTGNPVVALVLLHVIAAASIALLAFVAVRMVPTARRGAILLLVLVNPLVLLQLIGAAHWESLMVALVAAALLAWQRAHPVLAIAIASAAAAVKLPAAFAVVVFVTLHMLDAEPDARIRRAWRAVAAIVAPWLVLATLVPNVLGFRGALTTPLQGRTMYAPTTLLAEALSGLLDGPGVHVPFDSVLTFCRIVGLVFAAAACIWLMATVRRRPVAATIGLGLLAVATLGPVTYPWYLTWGLIPLALAGEQSRSMVPWISTCAVFVALPGCLPLGGALVDRMGRGPAALTAMSLAGVAVLIIVAVSKRITTAAVEPL